MHVLDRIKNNLIVSCQALEDEPLYDSYIMGKIALAAMQGGASGIRANTVPDIQAIKREVDLPIIGIIKADYHDSGVFITPTMNEIHELYQEGVDIISFDATNRTRPNGIELETFVKEVKSTYSDQLFMADVSTLEEGINAEKLGFDIVAPTLAGYTPYSKDSKPLNLVQGLIENINVPVIAEGNFDTPEKAKQALQIGAHAVVVGSAITRPKYITEKFINQIRGFSNTKGD